jgi:hypothetical protein
MTTTAEHEGYRNHVKEDDRGEEEAVADPAMSCTSM